MLDAFQTEVLDSSPLATWVAVSFPNPAHVPLTGEEPNPWRQVDAARAKVVWDAIATGSTATITLQPADLYSLHGGLAILVCTEAAPVVRAAGSLLEYAPSLVPADPQLSLPFTSDALQPYLSGGAQLLKFSTENAGTQAGVFPLVFANEVDGLNAATQLIAASDAAGASPLASFVIDFAALKVALGAALSAPRSLTIVLYIDIGVLEQGSLDFIDTCKP